MEPGSAARFQGDWGAQKVTASDTALEFAFYTVGGSLVDSYRLSAMQQPGNRGFARLAPAGIAPAPSHAISRR